MARRILQYLYHSLFGGVISVPILSFVGFDLAHFPLEQNAALTFAIFCCFVGMDYRRRIVDNFCPYRVTVKVRWEEVFRELGWVESGEECWLNFMRKLSKIPTSEFSDNGYQPVRDGITWFVLKRALQLVYADADDRQFYRETSLRCSRKAVRSGEISFPGFSVEVAQFPKFGFDCTLHDNWYFFTDTERDTLAAMTAFIPVLQFEEYDSEKLTQDEQDVIVKKRNEIFQKHGWKVHNNGYRAETKFFTLEHAKI